jgi:L-lactate dehydrogenase complex protein LldE
MLFPDTGKAVVRLLERLGHEVDFPQAQTCCGQMHYNTGYQHEALPMVKKFVEIFADAQAVVIPSSSCVAMIKDHYAKIAEDASDHQLLHQVNALLPRVWELSEFLTTKLQLTDVGAYYPHRVTYHPSCHGLRNLHLGDGPLTLLRNVRGIDLVELENPGQCCGFGGTFAVKNAETSSAMLADKVRSVLNTRAEVCTACDNSCLMHIWGSLHRQRTGVRTAHLAEILAGDESSQQSRAVSPRSSTSGPTGFVEAGETK